MDEFNDGDDEVVDGMNFLSLQKPQWCDVGGNLPGGPYKTRIGPHRHIGASAPMW